MINIEFNNNLELRRQNILKGLAIISVVTAHCNTSVFISSNYYEIIIRSMRIFGCIGVVVFFLISGYVFSFNRKKFFPLIKDKIIKIGIPWIISGVCIQIFYLVLNREYVSIYKLMIDSLIGNVGSYYLVMLFSYYIIFYFVRTKYCRYIIIILSIISNVLTSYGIIVEINPYFNPLNWSIYFVLGYEIGTIDIMDKIYIICRKYIVILVFLFGLISITFVKFNYNMGYWNKLYILYAILSLMLLMALAQIISEKYKNYRLLNNVLHTLGYNSFFIYLINFPIATAISKIMVIIGLWKIMFLSPLITILLIMLLINILKKIKNKSKVVEVIIRLSGIR